MGVGSRSSDPEKGIGSRIDRLLHILRALECGALDDADSITKELGISRRTLFRDLETLRNAGVRVRYRNNKYAIEGRIENPVMPSPKRLAEMLRQVLATAIPCDPHERQLALSAARMLAKYLPEQEQLLFSRRLGGTQSQLADQQLRHIYAMMEAVIMDEGCQLVRMNLMHAGERRTLEVYPQRLRHTRGDCSAEGIVWQNHRSIRVSLKKIASVERVPGGALPPASPELLDWKKPDIVIE